jgi:hypothetical protein
VGGECAGVRTSVLTDWRRVRGGGEDREREWMRRYRKSS